MSQPWPQIRPAERFALLAKAEVTELRSGARRTGWSGNLSRTGCYLSVPDPFPSWSSIRIILFRGEQRFEARGTLIHSSPGAGMGVDFEEVAPQQLATLECWLAELAG